MDRVKMINAVTGTEMSVPVDLVEMYKKAGHKVVPQEPQKKPVKRTRKMG